MISAAELAAIAEQIQLGTGIVFDVDRQAKILLPRLTSCMDQHGITNGTAALRKFKNEPNGRFSEDLIERILVKESFFFRDIKAFDHLREEILPALIKQNQASRRLRIWSTACANGQEPYSLAIMWHEMGALVKGWTLELLATDISKAGLAFAKKGYYSQFDAQRGMPIRLLIRYFRQLGDQWIIDPSFNNEITFKRFNLLEDFSHFGPFDLIMSRNVLLYLSKEIKQDILARFCQVLNPGGYLMMGGAESPIGLASEFENAPNSRHGFFTVRGTAKKRSATG